MITVIKSSHTYSMSCRNVYQGIHFLSYHQLVIRHVTKFVFFFLGQSAITFIYNFVEDFGGPHAGFAIIDGRPQKGWNTYQILFYTYLFFIQHSQCCKIFHLHFHRTFTLNLGGPENLKNLCRQGENSTHTIT